MKIVRFEPGDSTTYFVLLHRLSPEERLAIGGLSGEAVLFGCVTGGTVPYHVYPFKLEDYLDYSYYAEKMTAYGTTANQWTLSAGLHVFRALTGRSVGGANLLPLAELDWRPTWRDQLAPLLPEVVAAIG